MSREDWTQKYFVEKADLFLIVMDSKEMSERGRWLATCIDGYLRTHGITKARILDVGCGTGRIALPLAMMGHYVVGIDISPSYISIASERAKSIGLENNTKFIVCDARNMVNCVRDFAPFDVILFVWSTIIGYYDESTDVEILKQARMLSHDDTLLIIADTVSKDFISFLSNFVGGFSWFVDYGEHVVVEKPIYNPVTGYLLTKQLFYRKEGKNLIYLGEAHFQMKLYSLDELVSIAKQADWCLVEALRSFGSREPYRTLGALNVVFKPCRK